MRISAGSRGLSRNGGNIHLHPEIPFITTRPKIKNANKQSISLAPLAIRETQFFREFIRLSPASNYIKELVNGPGGLLSRGLEDHATSYGALPRTKQERAALAAILNDYVRSHFPEYAKSHLGTGVIGVPGFWQERLQC